MSGLGDVGELMLQNWKGDALFKYMKEEHASQLLNEGKLRIGTLYDFRDEEKYGAKQGDKDEGKKFIIEKINNLVVSNASEHNPLSPHAKKFINLNSSKNVTIRDCAFEGE